MMAPEVVIVAPERGDPVEARGSRGCFDVARDRIVVVGLEELPYIQAEFTPTLPEHLEITALRDARIQVLAPIPVEISRQGEAVIVEIQEIEEYGQGASLGEAIEDLQRGVAELFLTLLDEREALGSDLQRVRHWLQEKLEMLEVHPVKPA
jgi:hypothetical protein